MWRAKEEKETKQTKKYQSNASNELLKEKQTRIACNFEAPSSTHSYDSLNTFGGDGEKHTASEQASYPHRFFQNSFTLKVLEHNDEELVFEMIGIDTALANAFRRILIAEVPTMAFESIYLSQNTSIIQDEVLAHRIGLLPIAADPRLFEYKKETPTDLDTLVFNLDVHNTSDSENMVVYSKSLCWKAEGEQSEWDWTPKLVHDDIRLAILGPGQQIKLTALAEKGIGQDHAKFSPVATATYRLLPEVTLIHDQDDRPLIRGEDAKKLKALCPMGVFDIEDMTGDASVVRPRNCTLCRECIRDPPQREKIKLGRVKDHFIFTIESTGCLSPADIFREALDVLSQKCDSLLKALEASQNVSSASSSTDDN
eukprot:CAMPEP_0201552520 /NCGR_PEP_ID=MMETSP0173_2-20130828/16767_1 /ASSEMBLY_ACC=CAM_ASM_000268 /TAXON_ID=218659 /ORGANISM="Vexillifera sp., Strain DIVA3 564/2" /LENGTH=368 /DNA_ID=CAMNT_0047963021 /DNA_START=51 /DNA_END=1157 /DNA_ORIENTATION=+